MSNIYLNFNCSHTEHIIRCADRGYMIRLRRVGGTQGSPGAKRGIIGDSLSGSALQERKPSAFI